MLVNNVNLARTAQVKFGEGCENYYKKPEIKLPNLPTQPLKNQNLLFLAEDMLKSYGYVALLQADQNEQEGKSAQAAKLRENAKDCSNLAYSGEAPNMIGKAIKKAVNEDYQIKKAAPLLEMPNLSSDPLKEQPSLGTDILKAYRYVTLLNADQKEREGKDEEAQILKENAIKCHNMEKDYEGSSITSAIRQYNHMCSEANRKRKPEETFFNNQPSQWEQPSRGRWGY